MQAFEITPSGQSCGATVTGLDLSKPLAQDVLAELRQCWLQHHVLAFPDQKLSHDELEMFAQQFGALGDDPFFNPIPGRKHIAAVRREAEDTNPIFAEFWHSDWSFMAAPPIGTVLYAIDIPPDGGDTEFSNQHLSYAAMPKEMQDQYANLKAIHSPKLGYSLTGAYGDTSKNGAMDIRPSAEAEHMYHTHPLAPEHPETGQQAARSAGRGGAVHQIRLFQT